MKRLDSLAALAAGLIGALTPFPASAGPVLECNGIPITLAEDPVTRVSSLTLPAGSRERQDLDAALAQWNNLRGVEREFAPVLEFDGPLGLDNGQNEIAFTPLNGPLGLTYLTYADCAQAAGPVFIEEFDIEIASNVRTSLSGAPPEDSNRFGSIRQTMAHELGHALGLNHVSAIGRPSLLEPFAPGGWFGGDPATRVHPFGDDAATVRRLYPADETHTDVAATAFEVRRLENRSVTTMPPGVLTVPAGQTFVARAGIDNLGNTPESFDVVFVLSDNDAIAPTDPVVASGTATLGPAEFQVLSFTARVPEGLPAGTYRLGLILDPNDDIPELLEGNNTVVLTSRIGVP
jgi:hypothetical protein